MKNRIIAFATILLISLAAMAQSSMTDDQVLKYLVTETQKGTSQQKMASELLKKGRHVSVTGELRASLNITEAKTHLNLDVWVYSLDMSPGVKES